LDTISRIRYIGKPAAFALCLVPAAIIAARAFGHAGGLGANPIEAIQDHFGNWGLRFIMIALAVTPARQVSGLPWIGRFRRMLGLFAFFYVLLHFLAWLILDQGLAWPAILADVTERPFITIGFGALIILTAMAATSTAGMRRRLGRRWQQLHYGIYLVGALGVWHYWWQVKADIREPLVYAVILAALLAYRAYRRYAPAGQRRQQPLGSAT